MILLNDVQQKTKKGLARFGPDAQGAADSLQPLYVSQGGGGIGGTFGFGTANVSYTNLTLPTTKPQCIKRWSPYN